MITMETITKRELQKQTLEQVDAMFAAPDLDTFKTILFNITDRLETLPKSRWHIDSDFRFRITFWKDHLPEWMKWKYMKGHPLELRSPTVDIKHTCCWEISFSTLPGPAYDYRELSTLINEKAFPKVKTAPVVNNIGQSEGV